jgi:O-methyltransferase
LVGTLAPNTELLPRFTHDPLKQRYIHLARETVLNTPYVFDFETSVSQSFDGLQALTMVGRRRLDHLHALLQDLIWRRVPGDVIECGCWRGGVGLLAAAVLVAYEQAPTQAQNSAVHDNDDINSGGGGRYRWVWLADSFQGLPPVNATEFPSDASHQGSHDDIQVLKDNSVQVVENAATAMGLSHAIRLLPGFFNESLPFALRSQFKAGGFSGCFSLLRLDGDLYQSTLESLHYLYPLLSIGGHVMVDDFTDWQGTRDAVRDYRERHGINDERIEVTWHDLSTDPQRGELTRGVWWTKTKEPQGYDDDDDDGYSPVTRQTDTGTGARNEEEGKFVDYSESKAVRLPVVGFKHRQRECRGR